MANTYGLLTLCWLCSKSFAVHSCNPKNSITRYYSYCYCTDEETEAKIDCWTCLKLYSYEVVQGFKSDVFQQMIDRSDCIVLENRFFNK